MDTAKPASLLGLVLVRALQNCFELCSRGFPDLSEAKFYEMHFGWCLFPFRACSASALQSFMYMFGSVEGVSLTLSVKVEKTDLEKASTASEELG